MPLKKQFLKSKPEVKVTFEVSKEAAKDATSVVLLAEFNNWEAIPLRQLKRGVFKATVNVPTNGKDSYQFRYQFKNEAGMTRFDNDWAADAYASNDFGEENSVLVVTP